MSHLTLNPQVEDLRVHPHCVEISWQDGEVSTFASLWLRLQHTPEHLFDDEAGSWTDGANFHPRQDLAGEGVEIVAADLLAGGRLLSVQWRDIGERRYALDSLWRMYFQDDPVDAVPVVPRGADEDISTFAHADLFEPVNIDLVAALLRRFLTHGIVFISGVPRHERASIELIERISNVERSHLGDTFALRPRAKSHHIGEVMASIPLHIDLVYKQRPPDVQMLHALHQVGAGGENEFVDIFHIVRDISEADRKLLAEHSVSFVAESEEVHFRGHTPILVYDGAGRLRGCRYNEYKIKIPPHVPNSYYFAFERFRRLIRSPERKKTVLLPQDGVVIFDNWRILHGRRGFGDPRRHIIGSFLSADDLRSTYRVLAQRGRLAPPRYYGSPA
jgi:alpha-ketoglutarate-dependent taurine dioxygenase